MPSHDTKGGLLSLPYSLPHQQQTLGIFEFQLQPDDWQIVKQMCLENPLHAGTNTVSSGPRQIYDALNLVPCSLMQGELLKQCCLCGTLTVAVGSKTRVFHQAWRGCWLKMCFCGGNWKEVKWQDVWHFIWEIFSLSYIFLFMHHIYRFLSYIDEDIIFSFIALMAYLDFIFWFSTFSYFQLLIYSWPCRLSYMMISLSVLALAVK